MTTSLHIVCPHCHAVNRLPADRIREGGVCGKCHSTLFTGQPIELNESNFDQHISRSDLPIVVDFWAPWCAPCRGMAPSFAEAAGQMEYQYCFAKVDTEQSKNIAARFNIRSIPTIAIFRNGLEVARQAGAMNTTSIVNWVKSNS
jgi:thioredoxin 2